MTENLLQLNSIVSTATLIFEIIVAVHLFFYLAYIFGGTQTKEKILKVFYTNINKKLEILHLPTLDRYFVVVFFLFSLVASITTLVYSEYFGLIPCALCWFERIFMYGIVVLTGTSIYLKDDKFILDYVLIFSFFGACVALYHHLLQMTASATSHLPCPVSGGDCAKRIIFEYGHITFPWMAFVLFSFFIVIILFVKKIK